MTINMIKQLNKAMTISQGNTDRWMKVSESLQHKIKLKNEIEKLTGGRGGSPELSKVPSELASLRWTWYVKDPIISVPWEEQSLF